MSRLTPAARQLIAEVYQVKPKAKSKTVGEADGFGTHRQIAFDAATTKWLIPILESANDDRIESVETTSNQTVITFVPDVRADFEQPFGVAEADAVLGED